MQCTCVQNCSDSNHPTQQRIIYTINFSFHCILHLCKWTVYNCMNNSSIQRLFPTRIQSPYYIPCSQLYIRLRFLDSMTDRSTGHYTSSNNSHSTSISKDNITSMMINQPYNGNGLFISVHTLFDLSDKNMCNQSIYVCFVFVYFIIPLNIFSCICR